MEKTMKEWRLKRGMTQEDVSRLSGVKYSSLLAYENGYRMPPVDKAIKIAGVLGVIVEEIDWRHK